MKVVIDARMVSEIPHGFSRYVTHMLQGLAALAADRALSYEPILLVNSPDLVKSHGFATEILSSVFLNPRELLEIPAVLKKMGADLYHSPTFSSLLPAPAPGCPWVQTVHDLNHLHFGGARERLYYRFLLRTFAEKAAALATVSEFSRREIAEWLKRDPATIEVVPNAIAAPSNEAPAGWKTVLESFGLRAGSYFLCLSNPKPHKNLPLLATAYARYRAKAGESAWPLLCSVTGLTHTPGLIQAGPLSDHAGKALLSRAGAVVFPSLYEGFGLPPVEAAVVGIPSVVSDIPPHREGLQDLASSEVRWVEPSDEDAWARALESAASGELKAPSEASRAAILDRYSVSRLGRGMDRLYRRVLGLDA